MNIEGRVFECLCRGISDETWNKMKSRERKEYVKNHPTSRFAEKINTNKSRNKEVTTGYKYKKPDMLMKYFLNKCLKEGSKYTINEDGSIDVDGDISFNRIENSSDFNEAFLDKNGHLKIKFNKVSGDFILCKCSGITTLEGCPDEVGADFYCYYSSNLLNLKGAPQKVGGEFNCSDCENIESLYGCPMEVDSFRCESCEKLKNLIGSPQKVRSNFICSHCNSLKDLKGSPTEVGRNFSCFNCLNLETLEYAPQKVGGKFDCDYCHSLKDLKGAPQKVGGTFWCTNCKKLESLEGCPKEVGGDFECEFCKKLFTKDEVRKYCKVHGEIYAYKNNYR